MGCVDVMPFIPLRGADMDDCVRLSERVGKRIAEEAGFPYFSMKAQPHSLTGRTWPISEGANSKDCLKK